MGFIRGSFVVFLSTLLFVSVFLGNLFLTLSWSLEYENIEQSVSSIDGHLIDTTNFAENIYYKEYNCSFVDCLKHKDPVNVLISEKAKNYFQQKFYLMLLVSIILVIALILSFESKHSIFVLLGVIFMLSAWPFRKINWALNFLPEGNLTTFFSAFFTKSYNVFMIILILGFILLAIGIAIRVFRKGIGILRFFGWFKEKEDVPEVTKDEIKEIVKEEIAKEKSKEEIVKKIVDKEIKKSKQKKL